MPNVPLGKWGSSLLSWLLQKRVLVLCLACVLSIPTAYGMIRMYIGLRSDMEELLPPSSPAVQAVAVLRKRLPGMQQLGVVIRGKDPGPPAQFARDLAARIETYPPNLVRLVRADIRRERQFLLDNLGLYIPTNELRRIRKTVLDKVEAVRRQESHRNTDIVPDEPEEAPLAALDFSELDDLYHKADPFAGRFPDDQLVSPDGRMALVMIFIDTTDTGLSMVGPLFERVQNDVAALNPKRLGIEVGYAGNIAINVEELSALQSDLAVSGILVVLAVMASIVFYYRWFGALLALGFPLMVGVFAGFGAASFFVPYLNGSTAFLASIIVGNGINPGIILLARYAEERRLGHQIPDALAIALATSWRGTLAATCAAAVAYASLMTTTFRGFSQFGIIGVFGMAGCWLATMSLMPPLLVILDRGALTRPRLPGVVHTALFAGLAWTNRHPRAVLGLSGLLLLVSLTLLPRLNSSQIEYDMTKLRRAGSEKNGEGYWTRQMDQFLGRNFTSVALLAEREADVPILKDRLLEAIKHRPLSLVASKVVGPDDLLPADQKERIEELRQIRTLLPPAVLWRFRQADRARIERILDVVDRGSLTPGMLPELVAQGMRERDGHFGRVLLMRQSLDEATWNGQLTMKSAELLRGVASTVTPAAHVAGGFVISASIIETLDQEAGRTTAISFLAVVLMVVLTFRALRPAALVIGSLVCGMVLMGGAVIALGQRINFVNFMAFPVTFGIGVEYAVNVLQRWREAKTSTDTVLHQTGSAVLLCSLTTIIGYSSLLLAQNRALYSFGLLAVLGEITCAVVAVLVLPTAMIYLRRPLGRVPGAGREVPQ